MRNEYIVTAGPGWTVLQPQFDDNGDMVVGLYEEPVIAWYVVTHGSKKHRRDSLEISPPGPITLGGGVISTCAIQSPNGTVTGVISPCAIRSPNATVTGPEDDYEAEYLQKFLEYLRRVKKIE